MRIITVLGTVGFGVVVGFLFCHLVKRCHQSGMAYLWVILGVILGGIFIAIIADPNQTSWYLDGLGIGVLLYWIIMLGGRGVIKKLWMRMDFLPAHSSRKK